MTVKKINKVGKHVLEEKDIPCVHHLSGVGQLKTSVVKWPEDSTSNIYCHKML